MGQAMNDDVKRDEGLDTLTADDNAAPSASPPAVHQPTGAAGAAEPSTREAATEIGRGAIRGAYLARRLAMETEGLGTAEHEEVAASTLVRGAYVAHLATPDSGSAGDEHAGNSTQLLRGIYVARMTAAARSAAAVTPRVRLGKAKKAASSKSAANKAKKAAPARRAKKKAAGRAKGSGRAGGNRGRR